MGRAEYFDPISQSRKPIKSGSIVNDVGLEYTPEDVKEIDDKIGILKGAGVAKEKVDKTEFESHKAESANKHITESGSNSNGNYIKFDDGTQICWQSIVKAGVVGGGTMDGSWHFPIAFKRKTTPVISITPGTDSSTPANGAKLTSGTYYSTGNNQTFYYYAIQNTDTSARSIYAYMIAIGRWK